MAIAASLPKLLWLFATCVTIAVILGGLDVINHVVLERWMLIAASTLIVVLAVAICIEPAQVVKREK